MIVLNEQESKDLESALSAYRGTNAMPIYKFYISNSEFYFIIKINLTPDEVYNNLTLFRRECHIRGDSVEFNKFDFFDFLRNRDIDCEFLNTNNSFSWVL